MKITDDAYYHIYNRGSDKNLVFFEDQNCIYFINQFKKYVLPFYEVYSYCLMPNHFHLFVRINDKILFEKGIKNFFISYAKSVNKKYERVGSLFQGRYKASQITSDNYYTTIITYIHQNPVVAKLVRKMEDYRYSSYAAYLSDKATMIYKQPAIEWFGGLESFISHHQRALDEKILNLYFKI